jgi:hypothetical protein
MTIAYVDSSCIVAIASGERGAGAMSRKLEKFDELVSSNLLEAELRAVFVRERIGTDIALLSALSWIVPDRPLGPEIARVFDAGYVRGADCWHLASALYLADDPKTLSFITLDARQAKLAAALGFPG